jgi:hypothetical protein
MIGAILDHTGLFQPLSLIKASVAALEAASVRCLLVNRVSNSPLDI